MSALRAGQLDEWAEKINDAAAQFIMSFGHGEEGYNSLGIVYRMAKMDDPQKSLWMEVGR